MARVIPFSFSCLAACTLLDGGFQPAALPSIDAIPSDAGASDAAFPTQPSTDTLRTGAAADAGSISSGSEAAPTNVLAPALCPQGFEGFGAPQPVSGLGSGLELFGPSLSTDRRTLYFAGSGAGPAQLYAATRDNLDSAVFTNPTELASLNSTAVEGTPFVAAAGTRLYFFSDRSGGSGGRDLWFGERSELSAAFSTPVLLAGLNGPSSELLPWLTPDELTVLFVSTRPNGLGGADIWRATRARVDVPFDAPENAADLSSPANEGRVILSSDRLHALFSSDRMGGLGLPDLWTATRPDARSAFSTPQNLRELNSDGSDIDVALSSDGRELFFASSRSGSSQLWRSVRGCS